MPQLKNGRIRSESEFKTSLRSNYLPDHPRCPPRITVNFTAGGTCSPTIGISNSFPEFHLINMCSPHPWQLWVYKNHSPWCSGSSDRREYQCKSKMSKSCDEHFVIHWTHKEQRWHPLKMKCDRAFHCKHRGTPGKGNVLFSPFGVLS